MAKKLVILGAGESGIGTALLAKQKGYDVFVSDGGAIKPNFQKELEENNIELIYTCHIKPERFVEKTVIKYLKMSIKKLEKVQCEKPSGYLPNVRLRKMPKNK